MLRDCEAVLLHISSASCYHFQSLLLPIERLEEKEDFSHTRTSTRRHTRLRASIPSYLHASSALDLYAHRQGWPSRGQSEPSTTGRASNHSQVERANTYRLLPSALHGAIPQMYPNFTLRPHCAGRSFARLPLPPLLPRCYSARSKPD